MILAVVMAVGLRAAADQAAPLPIPPIEPVSLPPSSAPLSPDAMIAHAREALSPTRGQACANRRTADPDEILVCKARDSAYRLPLPEERGPPDRPRQRTGDVSTRPPGPACPPGGCTGINLLAVPTVLFKIVQKIVDPDS